MKKAISFVMASVLVMSLTACGNSGGGKTEKVTTEVTLDQITLGEDYTDIEADLKFLTHRTDVIDTKFKEFVEDFQKMYPNINIEYEAIANYAEDITTRLTTGDWGDICMIPTTVDKNELPNYFSPLGEKSALGKSYDEKFLEAYSYEGKSYGIPSGANVQGVVYNKAVFEEAGISELPKTPDEFLDGLQKIKDNTDAIPMYTNFAAGWTMPAWDALIDGGATGDPDFAYEGLTKGENPFSDRGDSTGPYAVYNTLYEAVKRGLIEDDPTTTDWEGSKGMMNRGEIGVMVLGSWALTQIQGAGENADDIAYMAFPITIDGKQYAAAGGDYNYGINCNSSEDEQIAAMCYIKYLVEESGLAQSDGEISVVIGDEYPECLADMAKVETVVNNPAPEEDVNLFNDINNDSELGINVSGAIATEIVEEAIAGTKTIDEMVDEWNAQWTAAQESNGITH